jgi:hypothetical protein
VSGTLWLLYFFYRYNFDVLNGVRLNRCTGAWPDCAPGTYFPFVLYVFAVCLMWVAAFSAIFVANNPYRRHGPLLSLAGVAVSHYFTFVVARQCLRDLDLNGNTLQLRGRKFFEIGLICTLQAGVSNDMGLYCSLLLRVLLHFVVAVCDCSLSLQFIIAVYHCSLSLQFIIAFAIAVCYCSLLCISVCHAFRASAPSRWPWTPATSTSSPAASSAGRASTASAARPTHGTWPPPSAARRPTTTASSSRARCRTARRRRAATL